MISRKATNFLPRQPTRTVARSLLSGGVEISADHVTLPTSGDDSSESSTEENGFYVELGAGCCCSDGALEMDAPPNPLRDFAED